MECNPDLPLYEIVRSLCCEALEAMACVDLGQLCIVRLFLGRIMATCGGVFTKSIKRYRLIAYGWDARFLQDGQ